MQDEKIEYKPCPECGSHNVAGEVVDWLDCVDVVPYGLGKAELWVGTAHCWCLDCNYEFELEAEGVEPIKEEE